MQISPISAMVRNSSPLLSTRRIGNVKFNQIKKDTVSFGNTSSIERAKQELEATNRICAGQKEYISEYCLNTKQQAELFLTLLNMRDKTGAYRFDPELKKKGCSDIWCVMEAACKLVDASQETKQKYADAARMLIDAEIDGKYMFKPFDIGFTLDGFSEEYKIEILGPLIDAVKKEIAENQYSNRDRRISFVPEIIHNARNQYDINIIKKALYLYLHDIPVGTKKLDLRKISSLASDSKMAPIISPALIERTYADKA